MSALGAGAQPAGDEPSSPAGESPDRSYGAGARILSIGLALTGVVTLGFFVLASQALDNEVAYGRIALLWSLVFLVCSVIYRPIEQLLARNIAEARARGAVRDPLRTPLMLQGGAAVGFVIVALLLRGTIETKVFPEAGELFWVLVAAVVVYSLSYFARGWLAGTGRPELYGALVFIESSVRCLFPIAVLLGLASGIDPIAFGIVAAPLASLLVVPLALRSGVGSRAAAAEADEQLIEDAATISAGSHAEPLGEHDTSLRSGAVFAGSTLIVMLCEQLLITAAVVLIAVKADADGVAALAAATGIAGAVFNAFLVSRAPLQLFQAVQSTLLPHLAALGTTGDRTAAAKALKQTMLVIFAFAGVVTLGLLAIGPWAINFVFGTTFDYSRLALALVGIGMGLHLAGGTLNQAALAGGRAPIAAVAWVLAATITIAWVLIEPIESPVMLAATGYVLASGALLASLLAIELRSLRG